MKRSNPADPAALRGCVDVCQRCERMVRAVESAPQAVALEAYRAIGPHLRHSIDHFNSLLRGVATGQIDYDDRDRDQSIESEPERFRAALTDILQRLASIGSSDLGRPLQVRMAAAPDFASATASSTVERELIFVSSHTIHHLALMVQLASDHGIDVPGGLGVAFSTEAHQRALRPDRELITAGMRGGDRGITR